MASLEKKLNEAEELFMSHQYERALGLYRSSFNELSEAIQKSRTIHKVSQGTGWLLGFVTGGLGLEDLVIIPAVTRFADSILGGNPEELQQIANQVTVRELQALANAPELLNREADTYLLRRFALLYSFATPRAWGEQLINLYLPWPAREREPTGSPGSLTQIIRQGIPQVHQRAPSINELLYFYADLRGWGSLLRSLNNLGYGETHDSYRQKQGDAGHARGSQTDSPNSHPTNDDLEEAYSLLGLEPGASKPDIKRAFRRVSREWHPDQLEGMAGELKSFATKRMQQITRAYQLVLEAEGYRETRGAFN